MSAGDLLECGGCLPLHQLMVLQLGQLKHMPDLISTYIGREQYIKVVVAAFDNAAYVEVKQMVWSWIQRIYQPIRSIYSRT